MASSMDERAASFENKFARDAELKFKAEARRNKLLGHWAAEKMGRDGDEYAREVIKADFEEAGDEDVYRKVKGDLDAANAGVSESEVRTKMRELLVTAAEQVQNQ